MRGSRVAAAALLLITPITAVSVSPVNHRKGVSPPVAPELPQPLAASSSSTLDSAQSGTSQAEASTTQSPANDLSSLLASLTSDLSASTAGIDTSAILASLSSQYLATLSSSSEKTQSTTSATPTSQSASTGASSSTTATSTSTSTSGSGTGNGITSGDSSDKSGEKDNRKLTIILAVVLTILFLFVVFLAAIMVMRYRRGQSPFSRLAKRGASPIDDDEIATWRTNSQAMAQTSPESKNGHNHTRTASSIIFSPSPGHSYTVYSHPNSPSPNTTPNHKSRASSSSNSNPLPPPPALVARAPNSRSGLTDETIPGADPFLPPLKRQSTRLSKAPGHTRTKSRRSSRGSVADANTQASNGGAGAGYGLGRFSFDRIAPENNTSTAAGRTRSLSERHGGGLGSNPFGGQHGGDDSNPFALGSDTAPGGLWPPPIRKMSFPDTSVGIAS